MNHPDLELSIVMPCLNEAMTVGPCVSQALQALEDAGICGEVIVADNGSRDASTQIAAEHGARVFHVEARGYGAAIMGGVAQARGRYVLMGDADMSYNFGHAPRFMEKLREGYDLVMGDRFAGGIAPGAMPALHYYLGNPALTAIGRLLFAVPVHDFHCGLRAFRRELVDELRLCAPGMEFASEMVVKAALAQMRIAEVPTTLSPDGRDHPPHLRPWRDGWRHLRFMVIARCTHAQGRRA